MKKLLLFLFAVVLLVSCNIKVNNTNRIGFANDLQYEFDSIHNDLAQSLTNAPNDIKKEEAYNAYIAKIAQFIDSNHVVHNWEGQISDIKSESTGSNSTAISFVITFTSPKYETSFGTGKREYKLSVDYVVNNDSLATDSIYQKVSNMSEQSKVYFDGIFREKADGTPHLGRSCYDSMDKEMQIGNPSYNFFIVDISESPLKDYSQNLSEAMKLSYDIILPLKLNFQGKISSKEKEKRWKQLSPKYEAALKKLSPAENSYIVRLNTAYTLNFLYAEN